MVLLKKRMEVLGLALLGLLLALLLHLARRPRLPPGLPRLPLLGSAPWLLWSGKKIMDIVKDDRRKYGDLSCVGFGFLDLVFINNPRLIREVLGLEEAAGRGRSRLGLEIKSWGRALGLIDPDMTPMWKEQKRFVLRSLREQGFGRKSEESVQEQARLLVDHVLDQGRGGLEVTIKGQFNVPVVNVIWKMIASKSFPLQSEEGDRFLGLMEELFTNPISPLCVIPVFGKLMFGDKIKKRHELFHEMRKLFEAVIDEHEETLDESDPRDLIDDYLIDIRNKRPGFDKQQLTIIILDLFAAGSETSSTTLRWAVLFLTLHPEVQERCQAELDVLASSPGMEDMARLPYCQATILEVLRLSCTAPGTLMHLTMTDIEVGGYTLPKGTGVSGNFMSTHMDPGLWDAPEAFSPQRFLDPSGQGLRDTPHFFPFSVGKRVCLGESLARVELFLFFTALVKHCQFLPVPGSPPDPARCSIGITRIPDPFPCRVRDRALDM